MNTALLLPETKPAPAWQSLARGLEHLHTLLAICDGNTVAWINAAGAAILGHAGPSTIIGRSFFSLLHHNYADLAEFGLAVFVEDDPLSVKLVNETGHDLDVHLWVRTLDDGCFLVECHDISEHLRSARALRQREQRLEGIINTVADGIIALDELGAVQTANPAAAALFGYEQDELPRRPLRALIPEAVPHSDDEPTVQWLKRLSRQDNLTGKHKHGTEFPIEISVGQLQQTDTLSFTCIVRDITARKAEEKRMVHMAHHDALTGLPNRHLFDDRVEEAFKRCHRHREKMALLFIDLDKFKPINDTYGHAVGDMVLREVAGRMGRTIRATDTIARVGGDEFMVLLEELSSSEEATEIATKIKAALVEPIPHDGKDLAVGASIGIGVFPDNAESMEALMDFADQAMYQAKNKRR